MSFRDAEKRELCSSVPVPCKILEEVRRTQEETEKRLQTIMREIFRECMHGAYNELRANQERRRTPRNAEITHGEPQEGTEGTPGDKLTE